MTITTTSLGTYTTQITLSGELNGFGLITAIDTAIVAAGWTQWDVTTLTKVYRSLNKDGTTYKYIGIYIDPYLGKINTTSYESWNNTTHVGTNETYTFGRTGEMGYCGNNTDVILMISPYWCLLQTYIGNQPSQWSGVIEFKRELPEDTGAAGYPCFAWVCSSLIFNKTDMGGSGTYYYGMSFPRTKGGLTGLAAATSNTGWQLPYTRIGISSGLGSEELNKYVTHAWDTSKKTIQSLRPTVGLREIHGTAFGLKALYNAGAPYNKITVPVDSTFTYSASGTNTEHWLLGETVYSNTYAPLLVGTNNTSNGYLETSTTTLNGAGYGAVTNGAFFYVITSAAAGTALQKIGATTTTLPTATTVTNGPTSPKDIILVEQYVYVITATGINRYDTTNNDAVSTLALPLGGTGATYDGTDVWVSANGSRASNTVYRVNPVTFTIRSTITLPNTIVHAVFGPVADYNGGIYIPTDVGTIYKIDSNTSAITTLTATTTLGGTLGQNANGMFDGQYLYFNYYTSQIDNYTNLMIVNPATGTSLYQGNVIWGYNNGLNNKNGLYKYGPYLHANFGGNAAAPSPSIGAQFPNLGFSGPRVGLPASPSNNTTGYIASDGARIYGCSKASSTFFQYVNINHPDDGATVKGKLALPK